MTKRSSMGATGWSLALAFLASIVAVCVVNVIGTATQSSNYSGLLAFVFLPLIGAIAAIPLCLILTLLAWASFALARRWGRLSRIWSDVVAIAAAVAIGSGFFALVCLILPTLREPRQLLAFGCALVVIVTIFAVRGPGHRQGVDVVESRADN